MKLFVADTWLDALISRGTRGHPQELNRLFSIFSPTPTPILPERFHIYNGPFRHRFACSTDKKGTFACHRGWSTPNGNIIVASSSRGTGI
jgi:hypothetical protein